MTPKENDALVISLLIAIALAIILAILYIRKIHPFLSEMRYIKMELRRSTGREYEYWERQLKRLYRDKLPIIGILFR